MLRHIIDLGSRRKRLETGRVRIKIINKRVWVIMDVFMKLFKAIGCHNIQIIKI